MGNDSRQNSNERMFRAIEHRILRHTPCQNWGLFKLKGRNIAEGNNKIDFGTTPNQKE